MVNRMARRDPALYPLSFILVGIAGVTGYFAMQKAFEPDVERRFSQRVNVWDGEDKHEVEPGTVAAFKYRYKTRDGHMEDAMPTMNVEVRKVGQTGSCGRKGRGTKADAGHYHLLHCTTPPPPRCAPGTSASAWSVRCCSSPVILRCNRSRTATTSTTPPKWSRCDARQRRGAGARAGGRRAHRCCRLPSLALPDPRCSQVPCPPIGVRWYQKNMARKRKDQKSQDERVRCASEVQCSVQYESVMRHVADHCRRRRTRAAVGMMFNREATALSVGPPQVHS